ncbi:peptidase inhibitor family I36 protein [Streptomyces roseirectus]|uniref:Peptidase inhibitor family I36 protein n=1 Tax=Streptomyces roseirectus TaxID=2768066 RepID=A0A7H0IFK6_9ACTN|nr:peptidase inhibitor family I36 protein [Streptomyces roseirectus]QNP71572.1 peptidase inhibitor family I36 protein [Streptomyces roseirectus]
MKKAIVALSAVAVATLTWTTPASAAPPPAFDCPANYSCYWTGASGAGSQWNAPSCGGWTFSGTVWNNNLGSIQNRGNGTVHLYDTTNYTGYLASIAIGGAVNLGSLGDRVGSIRINC